MTPTRLPLLRGLEADLPHDGITPGGADAESGTIAPVVAWVERAV